jgi:3-oxoacyl-[acyl-carrier protein] reductase
MTQRGSPRPPKIDQEDTVSTLTGKTALVTASSRGIGRAIAERLGADGANVVVNYQSNGDAAAQVVAAVEAAGSKAVAVAADMGDPAAIGNLYDQAVAAFGGVDIVVNNHAYIEFGGFDQLSLESYDKIFAVTARGTFVSMQHAARVLPDGGRIINISAGGTVAAGAGGSAYHGAKAAVQQFTTTASKELGHRGITVNAVLPGTTRTDGLIIPPQMVEQLVAQTSLGRLGEPEDIAAVVAFLAGPDGRWMTGQLVRAGGGLI